jgi:hypothetical protein
MVKEVQAMWGQDIAEELSVKSPGYQSPMAVMDHGVDALQFLTDCAKELNQAWCKAIADVEASKEDPYHKETFMAYLKAGKKPEQGTTYDTEEVSPNLFRRL